MDARQFDGPWRPSARRTYLTSPCIVNYMYHLSDDVVLEVNALLLTLGSIQVQLPTIVVLRDAPGPTKFNLPLTTTLVMAHARLRRSGIREHWSGG